jgi:site-specific DNA-adenine methylase
MTQYHGGKHRNGKKIAEVLNAELRGTEFLGYCEPFHGMLGVYRHIVYKPDLTYLAGDSNKSVMLMWKEAQNGWVPSSDIVSKEEFLRLKFNGESTAEKGFIGCTHAYGGVYFRCYCITEHGKKSIPNIAKRVSDIALNSVVSKVKFEYGSYTQFSDLRNFLIYCDPPYESTIGYRNDESKGVNQYDSFDNLAFWTWTKKMAEHNSVFVSECSIPKNVNYEVVLGCNYTDNNSQKRKDFLFKILN